MPIAHRPFCHFLPPAVGCCSKNAAVAQGKAEEFQTHTPGSVYQDLNYVVLFKFLPLKYYLKLAISNIKL